MGSSDFKNDSANMPVGARPIFLIQAFSTFSFAVLYSSLVLYATLGLHLGDVLATSFSALFIALNYVLHLVAGYIGGRFLSHRSLFCLGMFSMFLGCLFISVPNVSFLYWGVSLFLIGSGCNINCINCLLTQLFQAHDKKRETAFLWNYSALNVGAFLGFFMGGYFQLHHAYRELFLLSSVGNLIALFLALINWRHLYDRASVYSEFSPRLRKLANVQGIMIILGLFLVLRWALFHIQLSNYLILVVAFAMGIVMAALAKQQKQISDSRKISVYLIFLITACVYWALCTLAPMSLTLFIERNVDRHYLGMLVPPQWVQTINTLVIVIGGPLLSIVFNQLRKHGFRIPLAGQFAMSVLLAGAGFLVLAIGIHFADAQGYSHFNWVILSFVLQSLGELFIGPVGYAMVGQLAPLRLQSLMMGFWSMMTGVGAVFAGYFSKLTLDSSLVQIPLNTNANYSHIFLCLGMIAVLFGCVLICFTSFLSKLIQEHD